jgi:hypothetical protein
VLSAAQLGEGDGRLLLIPVDQEDIPAGRRTDDRSIDGDGGLADPAFGISHSQNHDFIL